MALDLEDQEQLDEFKAWWAKYGKLTINLVLLVLAAYVAWQGYQYFKEKKAVEASEIYQTLVQADPDSIDQLKENSAKLMGQYAGTPYAGRAAVLLAKKYYAADDVDNAKTNLQWAIDNAQESSVKAVASLQLASILLDSQDYAAAEKILSSEIDLGYVGLKDGLKGDLYLAQGKTDEAKKAYQSALLNLDAEGRLYYFTQQKLDALGG